MHPWLSPVVNATHQTVTGRQTKQVNARFKNTCTIWLLIHTSLQQLGMVQKQGWTQGFVSVWFPLCFLISEKQTLRGYSWRKTVVIRGTVLWIWLGLLKLTVLLLLQQTAPFVHARDHERTCCTLVVTQVVSRLSWHASKSLQGFWVTVWMYV